MLEPARKRALLGEILGKLGGRGCRQHGHGLQRVSLFPAHAWHFEEEPERRISVGVFERRKALYGSLDDLAEAFGLDTYENEGAVKLEVRHTTGRLKVSADNPFVTFVDQNDRRSTFHLQANVLHAAGRYFVPLRSFLPLFSRLAGRSCTYDLSTRTINVAAPSSAASGFDITSVSLDRKANGLLIRIHATRPLGDFESWLRQDGWLYVTVSRCAIPRSCA